LGVAAYLAIHLIQLLGLYVALTYFGGLWSGAESQGRHGWIAALLAAVVALLLLMGADLVGSFIQGPPSRASLYDQAIALITTGGLSPLTNLIQLLVLFPGFMAYGVAWRYLRARGKKEWVMALLVSVVILVIHEKIEIGSGFYENTSSGGYVWAASVGDSYLMQDFHHSLASQTT
jgi:hypothetical protein